MTQVYKHCRFILFKLSHWFLLSLKYYSDYVRFPVTLFCYDLAVCQVSTSYAVPFNEVTIML